MNGESSSQKFPHTGNIKENETKEKKVALNKKESVIDLSVDIRKPLKSNSSPSTSNCKVLANKKIPSVTNGKNKSKTAGEYFGPSKILQDFKNLTRNPEEEERKKHNDVEEDARIPEFVDSPRPNKIQNEKMLVKSLMQNLSSPSNSIHDMKKARAKVST